MARSRHLQHEAKKDSEKRYTNSANIETVYINAYYFD
jgi:hypothetical protein